MALTAFQIQYHELVNYGIQVVQVSNNNTVVPWLWTEVFHFNQI